MQYYICKQIQSVGELTSICTNVIWTVSVSIYTLACLGALNKVKWNYVHKFYL